MTFTVGGVDVTAVHVGGTLADAVYLGATKVWPAKSTTSYTDTFDADITGWTAYGGTWAWSADYGGTASKHGPATGYLISPQATFGTHDADVQVDIIDGALTGPDVQYGLVLDFVDENNYILVRAEPGRSPGLFEIYERINGTYNLRGRSGAIPGPNFTLRVTLVGTLVTVYVDGVKEMSNAVSVAALRDGGTGLYSKNVDVRFDNWSQTAS